MTLLQARMCRPAVQTSCVFGLAAPFKFGETELKEQSSQSQPWQDSSNKPLSQRRARKHLNLKLLLPVEIVQEDCLLERRKAPVKRAIWDRDDDSEPADSSILQPLKRMAL